MRNTVIQLFFQIMEVKKWQLEQQNAIMKQAGLKSPPLVHI